MTGMLFPANLSRYNPYATYRFLVYFGPSPEPVAAVSKVSSIKRMADVIEYKEGGNAIILKGLGRMKYDPITLERGVSQNKDFITWANYAQVLDHGHPTTTLANLRQELSIVLLNEEAQPVLRYRAPLLGVGIPGAARPRRRRECGGHRAHQARERGLGAGSDAGGAQGAVTCSRSVGWGWWC